MELKDCTVFVEIIVASLFVTCTTKTTIATNYYSSVEEEKAFDNGFDFCLNCGSQRAEFLIYYSRP